jgi:hypothetical protein
MAGLGTLPVLTSYTYLHINLDTATGSPSTWLKCPLVGRAFVLDLLEFVLLHRPAAFQAHSAFRALLQTKVCEVLIQDMQTTTIMLCVSCSCL